MTQEHEQELVRILGYFKSRGRTEDRDYRATELLYELIGKIEDNAVKGKDNER